MRPEQIKLALTLADGKLAIMSFVTRGFTPSGAVQFERALSDESAKLEFQRAGLDVVSWRIVDESELPSDRTYRQAWRDNGDSIGHDMAVARECHKRILRELRATRLAKLDVEYQLADEFQDAERKRAVSREKQRLRDITDDPRIALAQTIDELKAVVI